MLPRCKRQFDTSQVSRSENNHELGKATSKCEKVHPLYENAPIGKRSVDSLTRTDTQKQTETENGKKQYNKRSELFGHELKSQSNNQGWATT